MAFTWPSIDQTFADDEFREVVNKLPPGVVLTMISDSCHSGGLIENEKEQIGESSLPELVSAQKAKKKAPVKRKGNTDVKSPPKGGGKGKRDPETSVDDVDHDYDISNGDGVMSFHKIHDKMQEKLKKRGIHLDHQYIAHDEHFQNVCYMGNEKCNVKSRALSLSTLMAILKQKTGKEEMNVHKIRSSIIEIHYEDRTLDGKVSMDGLQMIGENTDESSSHHHHWNVVGALTSRLVKRKADTARVDDERMWKDNVVRPRGALGNKKGPDKDDCKKNAHRANKQKTDMGVLVSGCQSHETSADAYGELGSEGYGAMSNAIQIVLSRSPGPITNFELVTQVREVLELQGFTQQPGLYCSDENAQAPFIC
jgi:hypothetical protein